MLLCGFVLILFPRQLLLPSSPKNVHFVMIYSLSYNYNSAWLTIFCKTQSKFWCFNSHWLFLIHFAKVQVSENQKCKTFLIFFCGFRKKCNNARVMTEFGGFEVSQICTRKKWAGNETSPNVSCWCQHETDWDLFKKRLFLLRENNVIHGALTLLDVFNDLELWYTMHERSF